MIRYGSSLVGLGLCLLAAFGAAPLAEARRHRHDKDVPPVQQPELTFDEAVAKLAAPATWCAGAQALRGMPEQKDRAVPPLLRALGQDQDGGDRSCLKAALGALASRETAWLLFDAGGQGRRDGLLLMEAVPDDQHLSRILQVILDLDPQTRALARRALFAQDPTPAWEVVVLPLLDAEDRELRGQAIRSVARRLNDRRIEALEARLPKETDPALRTALQKIVSAAKAR